MLSRAVGTSPGEWYLGVHCRRCRELIPVFRDLNGGGAVAAGRGKLTVVCPGCGKRGRYRANAVMSVLVGGPSAAIQEAPGAGAAPRWADPVRRRQLVTGLQPMLEELKVRAIASGRDVLARVVELFAEYLATVPPEQQKPAALEQYMNAVFVLSRGSRDPADEVGQELVATLSLLNRRAVASTQH